MTVAELIAELQKHPQDAEAMATWEGTIQELDAESVYASKDGIVLIDADSNSYKAAWQKHGIDGSRW